MTHHTKITLHYSLAALEAEKAKLSRQIQKEYETRGNTEKCQMLFDKYTKIDEQIKARRA